jgi:hypothetical protein
MTADAATAIGSEMMVGAGAMVDGPRGGSDA